jgi:hypothetical protein
VENVQETRSDPPMLRNRSFGLVLATSMTASLVVLAQNAASPKPRQLEANGTDLTFVDQGKGAPIVFVHGAVGDLRFWEPQRAAFAKNHRYVAYTLRYHGTGAWPDAGKHTAPTCIRPIWPLSSPP